MNIFVRLKTGRGAKIKSWPPHKKEKKKKKTKIKLQSTTLGTAVQSLYQLSHPGLLRQSTDHIHFNNSKKYSVSSVQHICSPAGMHNNSNHSNDLTCWSRPA